MVYTTLGRSGLRVSKICLGTIAPPGSGAGSDYNYPTHE